MKFSSNAQFGIGPRGRRGERGQTILLVAISIVSLLAMAALAIDVVSLYVAGTEIQRSADAAALAGAKAMADSGVTTLQPTDGNLPAAKTLAESMATQAIQAILQATPAVNSVAGGTPVLANGTPTFNWGQGNGNPQITVTLQQTNLPTFFARIFGSSAPIATATATAEAYNPANLQSYTPIQTTCVKPWLVANSDPVSGQNFVNRANGLVEAPTPPVMGEKFWLSADCKDTPVNTCTNLISNPPAAGSVGGDPVVQFVPLSITAPPNTGDVCPSSTASPCGGGNNPAYKSAEECCSITPYTCGGNLSNPPNWDQTLDPEDGGANSDFALGTECLIHTSSTGLGTQDTLDWTTTPFPTGPPRILAGSGPEVGNLVSTSSSIVTIPILDTQTGVQISNTPPYPVTVVGFLQAFVNEVDDLSAQYHHGDVYISVLNVIGCSQTPNGNAPVVGGNGASPIPVRLVSPQ